MKYNLRMKAYVKGYRPIEKGAKRPEDAPEDNNEIFFTRQPEWTPDGEEAKAECKILNEHMRFHTGSHYCVFSVEELPGGLFAVVCLTHPDWPE